MLENLFILGLSEICRLARRVLILFSLEDYSDSEEIGKGSA
jgi:hypothetical protein